jgi:hypothetical protein
VFREGALSLGREQWLLVLIDEFSINRVATVRLHGLAFVGEFLDVEGVDLLEGEFLTFVGLLDVVSNECRAFRREGRLGFGLIVGTRFFWYNCRLTIVVSVMGA